jgi:uncharacterized protein (DUF2225 family)
MSEHLWNKQIKCPLCGHEFETTRLRTSSIKIKEKETDFGMVYQEDCAYFYAVTACPHCTFAARNEEFESLMPEYEPKLMELCRKLSLSSHEREDIYALGPATAEQAVKRHEQAVAFWKHRAHPDLGELAGLWMHLAWIHRLAGDKQRERLAMEEAAKAYAEYYEKGHRLPEKLGEPGILYLIGELYRRLGRFKEGRRYYERALASKELGAFPNIENLCRDQMLVAKTQMEEENKGVSS